MMNSLTAKYKFSRLEGLTGNSISTIFVMQFFLALLGAVVGFTFMYKYATQETTTKMWYLKTEKANFSLFI